ncbi:MAG: LptF/LptG family permease [Pseudarcicella sp.]|nr:LptF/LptG family permease [Pseudarcicella sp.]MBP6410888.1 LptF/LptG family permease [Pseudarcicella sp.]
MKILDKYILKKYLSTYIFAVLIIVTIIIVIDYTEKIDDFHTKKAPNHAILFDYYLNFIPYWANYISPLMVFISTVFFTANLAVKTEIIAILSTGVSFIRFLKPYFIGSTIIGLFTFYAVGWIIPKANKTRIAFEQKYVAGAYSYSNRNVHIKIDPENYVYMESYDNYMKTGYKFTIEKIKNNQLISKLTSDRITWDSTSKKWKIMDYRIRTFENNVQKLKFGTQLDTALSITAKDFESNYQLQETFTNNELEDYIKKTTLRGADGVEIYLIEKYMRYATPFGIVILTIIGAIVSARKSRGGVGFQIALGFLLAFVYIIFFLMSRGIAQSGGLNPMLAVWLPNIVFGGIGALLYFTVPR